MALPVCQAAACDFDATATTAIVVLEIAIVAASAMMLYVVHRLQGHVFARLAIMAAGVLVFEFFTAPMWNNFHLGPWAYAYRDVSWILTLGWSALLLATVAIVERWARTHREWQVWVWSLSILTAVVLVLETVLVEVGVRSYAPEVDERLLGPTIGSTPIEALYYVPVFVALVLGFYRYWFLMFTKSPRVPMKRTPWIRNFVIAAVFVVLFEVLVEPMIDTRGLPSWSYVFRDISVLFVVGWIVLIWLGNRIVERLFPRAGIAGGFALSCAVISGVALPVEAALIRSGHRVYGPSTQENFSGYHIPELGVPIEVGFAFPFYLALVLSCIRFWQLTLDNDR